MWRGVVWCDYKLILRQCKQNAVKGCASNKTLKLFQVLWRWEVLPSRRWNANGKHQLEIQVSRRFDFALLACSPVHVSPSSPPTVKPCRTSVFESAELSSGLCGGRKCCPQEDEMPTRSCKLEIQVSRRVDFSLLVWCGVVSM